MCFGVSAPVGYWFFWTHFTPDVEGATAAAATGLVIVGSLWVVGLIWLGLAAVAAHAIGKPDRVVATNGSVAINGDCTQPISITTTAAPRKPRRTAISHRQWGDIEAWSFADDDVRAIAERYEDGTYEVIDALPGTTLPDGRFVHDIASSFMYPHGARAAKNSARELLSQP